jgi:predicted HD phosphohydrolase
MMIETVSYTRMDEGTREDYELALGKARALRDGVADHALGLLESLIELRCGLQVDRYEHSLQTATRAHRDSQDEEMVVCALLHDIGDRLAPENHSQFAAAVLRPYVSEDNYWMIAHHGIFQGYYYFHHIGRDRDERERHRGHPAFERTVEFCEKWDQRAFDPAYDSMPLEAFEPMVRRLFAREPFGYV